MQYGYANVYLYQTLGSTQTHEHTCTDDAASFSRKHLNISFKHLNNIEHQNQGNMSYSRIIFFKKAKKRNRKIKMQSAYDRNIKVSR